MPAGQVVFVLPFFLPKTIKDVHRTGRIFSCIFAAKENQKSVQDRSYLYFLFLLPKIIKDVCRTGRICTSSFCCQRKSKMCTGQVVFVLPLFSAKENRRCVQDRPYLFFPFLLPKRIEDVFRIGRIYILYFCRQRKSRMCAGRVTHIPSYNPSLKVPIPFSFNRVTHTEPYTDNSLAFFAALSSITEWESTLFAGCCPSLSYHGLSWN